MADLYLVRHHYNQCPHKEKGQKFLYCKCVLGVDGELNGKRYRRSLFTHNLEKAQRKLAQLQNPNFREPKLLKDAIIEFLKANSDLAHGTLRNQRRILVFLYKIAMAAKLTTLEDFDVESMDLYRSKRPISALTWTKELAILRQFLEFCLRRKWIGSNPAREVRPPKLKPKPKEPYTQDEVCRIIEACNRLGKGTYERSRVKAMVLLLQYTGLRISDVSLLARDRVRNGRIYFHAMKNGKLIFLPIPPELEKALTNLAEPKGTIGPSKYFFWSGNGTTRALVRGATRTLGKVFKISKVSGAHAHRFRHTLATALLAKGWTTRDVADVLGSSEAIITRHKSAFGAWRKTCGMSAFCQGQKISL